MAWIESHDTLARHPKTRRAARQLAVGIPQMIGHLHCLWWWALEYADDGDLSAYEPLDLADGALWEGEPEAFVDALCQAGFLQRGPESGLLVHDWDDYAGRIVAQRQKNAEKQRAWRAAHTSTPAANSDVTATGDVRNDNVTVTSPATQPLRRGTTVPDRTVPNQTVPVESGEPPPAPARDVPIVADDPTLADAPDVPAHDQSWAAHDARRAVPKPPKTSKPARASPIPCPPVPTAEMQAKSAEYPGLTEAQLAAQYKTFSKRYVTLRLPPAEWVDKWDLWLARTESSYPAAPDPTALAERTASNGRYPDKTDRSEQRWAAAAPDLYAALGLTSHSDAGRGGPPG